MKEYCDRRLDWEIISELSLKTSFGGSLEQTGTCAVGVNLEQLDRATAEVLIKLQNELGLHHISNDRIRQFREEQKNKIPAFMVNLPLPTVICAVSRLVSYFQAEPLRMKM